MREKSSKRKIYPQVIKDKSLKFVFFDNDRRYTIRFSGNPVFLLEYIYKEKWWTDFLTTYDNLRNWHRSVVEKDNIWIMMEAVQQTEYFLRLFDKMWMDWVSPLVIYAENKREDILGQDLQ